MPHLKGWGGGEAGQGMAGRSRRLTGLNVPTCVG